MRDNISRSSIFRDSMRRKAEKKQEERKNIKVAVIGNIDNKPKNETLMKAVLNLNNKENENIGKEPGE